MTGSARAWPVRVRPARLRCSARTAGAERGRAGRTRTGHARAEPVTPTLLRGWPLPGGGSGKDDRGSVLVIGGARGTPGAALLAGIAALRSGAGKLMLAVAESTAVQLAVALPEAGVTGLPELPADPRRAPELQPLDTNWRRRTPSAWGPGWTTPVRPPPCSANCCGPNWPAGAGGKATAAGPPSSSTPTPWAASRGSGTNSARGPGG